MLAVTNNGGVAPVGFLTLQPLVNQLDGYGNATPHGPIYNVPYFRLQGGANAIIIDPQVGDIGFAGFADRDISSVKANKGQANPGSKRQFSMADAVYMGGILNGTPSQYIAFSASGVAITSPTAVTITAPTVNIDASTQCAINSPNIILNGPIEQGQGSNAGNASMGGTLTVTTDVIGGGKSLKNHTHPDPQGGNTGPPN
ncbi:oxidoreductase [Paraburkholderia panacisoli]|uniref:oxidoreductase n=1 Tax=Paraburkholderia panacisoli TaxID=2603818 RepID=UPI001FE9B7D1|nr:oxidoreductase [Paraburkholderia panacisoli]